MSFLDRYIGKYYSLKSLKSSKRKLMYDSNKFFKPDDAVYSGNAYVSVRKGELLDTTGTDSLKEFVTFALGLYFDTDKRWFTVSLKGEHTDNIQVKVLMEQRSEVLFKYISETNYYSESSQYDWDCLVHGHGLLTIEKRNKSKQMGFDSGDVVVRSKNPYDVFFDSNSDGDILDVYWEEHVSRSEAYGIVNDKAKGIPEEFTFVSNTPSIVKIIESEDASKSIKIINCYSRISQDFFPKASPGDYGELVKKGYKYIHTMYIEDINNNSGNSFSPKGKKGYFCDYYKLHKTKTCFPVRDVRTREHPYGEGQGKVILPKARILNRLMAAMIKATALQVDPVLSVTSSVAASLNLISGDKDIRSVKHRPVQAGDVYIHSAEDSLESNVKPIEVLQITTSINEMHEIYKEQQLQLVQMLPSPAGAYKVARQSGKELDQRSGEQSKRMGSIRANYTKEGLTQHLKRFYELAKKDGKFRDLPLPEGVKEGDVDFTFDAFLLESKRVNDSIRLAQVANISAQLANLKPSMIDWIDGDGIIHSIFYNHGLSRFLLSPEAVAALRKQRQQQQKQKQDMEQQSADAGLIKASTGAIESFRES